MLKYIKYFNLKAKNRNRNGTVLNNNLPSNSCFHEEK